MELPAELEQLQAAFPLGKIDTGEGLEQGLATVVEMEIEEQSAVVVFWRGEKIGRIELHLDRETAMEAAGLSGEDAQSSSS